MAVKHDVLVWVKEPAYTGVDAALPLLDLELMRLTWVQDGVGVGDNLLVSPALVRDGVGDSGALLVAAAGEPRDCLAGLQLTV